MTEKTDEYWRWEGVKHEVANCPCCGAKPEIWNYTAKDGTYQRVVMCETTANDLGTDHLLLQDCPLYMPPMSLYALTATRAVKLWNEYVAKINAFKAKQKDPADFHGEHF